MNNGNVLNKFHSRLPYNSKAPLPYLLTMITQCISFTVLAAAYFCPYIIFFGICYYSIVFIEDFQQVLDRFGQMIVSRRSSATEMRAILHELIQFHGDSIQLSGFLRILWRNWISVDNNFTFSLFSDIRKASEWVLSSLLDSNNNSTTEQHGHLLYESSAVEQCMYCKLWSVG